MQTIMRTRSIKNTEIEKDWLIADANGQTLGRFASKIAQILRGKHKVNYTPHMDMGDFVVVINAEKILVTGNKENQKMYFKHTGYPGGTSEISLAHLRQKNPEKIIQNAVRGMLPHNRLGRKILNHLKVYKGEQHPHRAQKPKTFKL
tara:strand:- start:529 stop:969 length:441 start_codon:yes stop_codon:yes gene_type:complete